ncbi:hypothetical protein Gura_0520 [Geotalea uraniireducens Rf4]|uniref:Uncharacterized protein n=1 Tax=Geotalea uraniireducens (strain Rf4) TaxID=351605 RepID=A5GCG6_GEOUR|nr:hypothetical protein Gura_0520 [Geotalea uraniireducens Rf4]
MHKRLLCTVIATAALCLVFLGMRVPNLSKLHSPKPRPRAIIETTVKAGQPAGIRVNADVVTCQIAPFLAVPTPFSSSFHQEIRKFNFIPIEHHTARAPPVNPV